ncbi:MAG TPA: hypothetical protein VM283_04280, partial [Armatimonadota bacterium]|nr:hypothetical protein [Armatimonadota bacterium]
EVELAQAVRNFHFEYPTERGPDATRRPKLLMWFQPKRGTASAEPWLREYSTGLDAAGEPVPPERMRAHLRRRLQLERDASVDGILLNLGLNPLSADAIRGQMAEDYVGTGIPGVETLQVARELGMDRSMPLLYFAAVSNDTWQGLGDAARMLELTNGRKWLDWRDDASWGLVLETVREMARQAAAAGCPGVAFDIEPYTTGIDLYIAESYVGVDAAELLAAAERRGREMAEAINGELPGAEIIWLAGYASDKFTLHNALFRGLTSVRAGGVQIATEGVYSIPDPGIIRTQYDEAWQFGLTHAGDADYWREKCGVAHGSCPLLSGADRCLTPDQVRTQLRAFADQQPPPKYMWWYTGSLTNMDDPEWAGYRAAYDGADLRADREEADGLRNNVWRLLGKYWEGFRAESTSLVYHHRLNGPRGLAALTSPEEVAARQVNGRDMPYGYGSGIQDAALENGELLYALCDAYEATGDERLAQAARRTWQGMKLIGSVSPVPGFVPRGPHPDGKSYYPNSSRDQHAVYVYALWRWFCCPLATDEDRAFVASFLDAFARRMEGHEWSIYVEDDSEVAHVGFSWRQRALPGVISLLGCLSAVADATGKDEWRALLERYEAEDEAFRWAMLRPESLESSQALTLYSNQFGLDLDALATLHRGDERGEQVRAFARAYAERALRSNAFDTSAWRRLDWADQWDDQRTGAALEPLGLSLARPATVFDLWDHFPGQNQQAQDHSQRNVANKLCFGIPTVAMHLALLSRDPELVAQAGPVVREMVRTMLEHGGDYDSGENFNRSVVMGLHLLALTP